MMKSILGMVALTMGLSTFGSAAVAQTSFYYAGQAENGQQLIVDLNSIASVGDGDAEFDYLLGEERIASQAHCVGVGAWTTLSDGTVHYAQSQATRDMVRIVCGYLVSDRSIAQRPALASPASSVLPADNPLPEAPPSDVVEPVVEPPFIDVDPSVPIAVEPYESAQSALNQPALNENPAAPQQAFVYDPSSNVRASPNGRIICSIDTRVYINIYGRLGDWYNTDACGSPGMIHISQIQF